MSDVLNWAAARAIGFRNQQSRRPPSASISSSTAQAGFDAPTPETGEAELSVIDALVDAAEPGLMTVGSKGFFGWVIGGSINVGVAADWLTSAWGQNAGIYASSPAAAMAEKIAGRWLLDILDLPEGCSVGFVTGATMANFTCLAAARDATLSKIGINIAETGLRETPRIGIFLGADAHVAVFTALRYLGFGSADIHCIETDADGRMSSEALGKALSANEGPAIVIAQVGQINTGAIDPIDEIAGHCSRFGAWLHVDGAFGLWGRALPEMAGEMCGIGLADSWATDGHKWLQVPYDSGFAIVRDARAHKRAMNITASYLPSKHEQYEPAQFVPELSRRARGFAVWAIIRHLGRQGIVELVRGHCRAARIIADRLREEPGISVINRIALNQIILSFGESDELTRAVIERLQLRNKIFVGGANWHGKWVMRISVIGAQLTENDCNRTAEEIIAVWREISAEPIPPANNASCLAQARLASVDLSDVEQLP